MVQYYDAISVADMSVNIQDDDSAVVLEAASALHVLSSRYDSPFMPAGYSMTK